MSRQTGNSGEQLVRARFARGALVCALAACWCAAAGTARAEDRPAADSQPAAATASLVYEVNAKEGNPKIAPTGTDLMRREGWAPLKAGDVVRAGQMIHVPIRSRVKLIARPSEPPTVLLIDSSTMINISELDIRDGAAHSRIQIAHGLIKAGVAEGEVRSDMEIESPTATLSKKGTDIFGMEVQADGRFTMFLTSQGRGLVQGILNQAGQVGGSSLRTRNVTPGQWITQQMIRAIDNVQFDQKVFVNDPYGMQGLDQLFALLNDRGGFGFLLPVGNNSLQVLGGASQRDGLTTSTPGGPDGSNPFGGIFGVNLTQGTRFVPGGDFGIGQGTVPSVFSGSARGKMGRMK